MKRYSTLRGEIFSEVLAKNLRGAKAYDRIAGYFSSSILSIAGEALEEMEGTARIICNSDLEVQDVQTAKLAEEAMRQEWCSFQPEQLPPNDERFKRLYDFIKSGKLEIRVLPKDKFGLEHGKAGVFTLADGSRTSFMGSANASFSGWKTNYELVWEDDTDETVRWVQEEFDSLWNHSAAVPLAKFVIDDIERISHRQEIPVDEWRNDDNDPAAVAVESPVFRAGFGLWEHQKFFIERAFRDHKMPYGARYVLADQVGLGKTVQLAISAELMALYGDKPILVIVPKALLAQWQNELKDLLGLPSALWHQKGWMDEEGTEYPLPINKCPRRIGIISQGIISNGSESCRALKDQLLHNSYECVIVDEAHRARRKNLSEAKLKKSPEMNNLYAFLMQISSKTHSMLLATATPVQLHKLEAFDLLNILSQKNGSVLGETNSKWRHPNESILSGLDLITGEQSLNGVNDWWQWIRNPFPPAADDERNFGRLRRDFHMEDDDYRCVVEASDFTGPQRNRVQRIVKNDDFFGMNNPYIRHIVRRDREYLETHQNPETGQPYLPRIEVEIFGENTSETLVLESNLGRAYRLAEEFCEHIQARCKSAGLFKTLLLKRVGSSMIAGLNTGLKMLEEWNTAPLTETDDIDDSGENNDVPVTSELKQLTPKEQSILEEFVQNLQLAMTDEKLDPKYKRVVKILGEGLRTSSGIQTKPWMEMGCIIFSQFFDTADWVARCLSNEFDGDVAVYAGGDKSRIYTKGEWRHESRDMIKQLVRSHKIKILVGTDAASEGLNLQTLGTLINLDLPWNPTRLEQRKGRIQRIGQVNDKVYIYNMRYRDSVEDRVHSLLSNRMESIYKMFGQLPDVLEDIWVDVAVGNIEAAKQKIDAMPKQHPFELKYHELVGHVDWESCSKVLRQDDIIVKMKKQW